MLMKYCRTQTLSLMFFLNTGKIGSVDRFLSHNVQGHFWLLSLNVAVSRVFTIFLSTVGLANHKHIHARPTGSNNKFSYFKISKEKKKKGKQQLIVDFFQPKGQKQNKWLKIVKLPLSLIFSNCYGFRFCEPHRRYYDYCVKNYDPSLTNLNIPKKSRKQPLSSKSVPLIVKPSKKKAKKSKPVSCH